MTVVEPDRQAGKRGTESPNGCVAISPSRTVGEAVYFSSNRKHAMSISERLLYIQQHNPSSKAEESAAHDWRCTLDEVATYGSFLERLCARFLLARIQSHFSRDE